MESEWVRIYTTECYHSPKINKISQNRPKKGNKIFTELFERAPKIEDKHPNKNLTFDPRKKVL